MSVDYLGGWACKVLVLRLRFDNCDFTLFLGSQVVLTHCGSTEVFDVWNPRTKTVVSVLTHFPTQHQRLGRDRTPWQNVHSFGLVLTSGIAAKRNEIDAHLTDAAQIAAFATFLRAARTEVHRLRPNVPVAAKLTAAGLLSDPDRWQTVMDAGDAAFVTYYPLEADFTVRPPDAPLTDLPALVTASHNLPLYVLEAGYPSAGCTTTPDDQSAFFRALLTAWDMPGRPYPPHLADLAQRHLAQRNAGLYRLLRPA